MLAEILSDKDWDRPFFKHWFGKSRVVDKDGNPLAVYRGEHGESSGTGLQSRIGSLSFTNDAEVASLYATEPNNRTLDAWAQAPRVTKAYLKIENPIMDTPDDPFIGLDVIEKALGRSEAVRIARKFAENIENTNNWEEIGLGFGYKTVPEFLEKNPDRVGDLYFDTYNYLDDAEEVAKLKAAGYDGAIHGGNGESSDAVEYKVFSPDQVKSAIGYRCFVGAQRNLLGHGTKRAVGKHLDRAGVFLGVDGILELAFAGEVLVEAVNGILGDDAVGGFEVRVKDGLPGSVEFDGDGAFAEAVDVEGVGVGLGGSGVVCHRAAKDRI